MLLTRLYYEIKPFLPFRIRNELRRWSVRRKLAEVGDIWPIDPTAGVTPDGWPGWPDGKRFAVLLAHDVETEKGLENVKPLVELEESFGFKSVFYFVPEKYRTPRELRDYLQDHGFEVGIHGLKHDGKLYKSRTIFRKRAERINHYLKEWRVCGFRSPLMQHNLEWLHDLEIEYDASTFDTDPFEPQPDAIQSIYPMWIYPPAGSGERSRNDGYIEIPYTLPQDSTLFLLLENAGIDVWRKKANWLIEKGGLVNVTIHPDYIDLRNNGTVTGKYPLKLYTEFLKYLKNHFDGQFWQPTPAQLAVWFKKMHLDRSFNHGDSTEHRYLGVNSVLQGKRAAVVVYSHFPEDPRPMREARALKAAGMQVDYFCLRKEGQLKAEVVDGMRIWRIKIEQKRNSKFGYIWRYSLFFLQTTIRIGWNSLNQKYALVHAHNMPDFLAFTGLYPKVLGGKVLLDLHDPMPELMQNIFQEDESSKWVKLLKFVEKVSIQFSDKVITPNIAFASLFVSRSCPAEKIEIIINSPQEDLFSIPVEGLDKAKLTCKNSQIRIMYHGSIVPRHGLDLAVRAISEIKDRFDLVLEIYGDKSEFLEYALDLAERLNVKDVVRYHGAVDQKTIVEKILKVHLGVIPNVSSPFTALNMPTRIFEYLALGKPVIAPDTRGIRDYFTDESMYFFKPGDCTDLAAKIVDALSNPEEMMKKIKLGNAIYRQHSWKGQRAKFVKNLEALLE